MITSVTIDRLRGIKHGEVPGLTGLSILVGPNGCGKSTVLDALMIGGSSDPCDAVGLAVQRRTETPFGYQHLLWRDADNAQIKVTGRDGYDTTFVSMRKRVATVTIYDSAIGPAALFVSDVRFKGSSDNDYETSANLWGSAFVRLIEAAAGRRHAPLSQVWTHARQLQRDGTALEMLRTLVPGFSGLELLANPDNSSVLNMGIDNRPIPVTLAGEGISALVRVALELAECVDGGTALLEEPELHQHPRSLRLMAQGICESVKRGVQVVLTTHSSEMIDALLYYAGEVDVLDNASAHLMRLRGGELTVARLDGAEARFQTHEIGEDLR